MREDLITCVCCENEYDVVFNPRDTTENGAALCLKHAKDLQKIINHLGNYPTGQ